MKKLLAAILSIACFASMLNASGIVSSAEEASVKYAQPVSAHETYNMNLDWKFFDTNTDKEIWTAMATADKNGKKFYEKDYDDTDWESVSIPHTPAALTAFRSRITDGSGNYLRRVLLYRKTFTLPQDAVGKKIFFELEGIRQAAYVWVNGQPVGYYEAGITAFGFDLTNYVTAGEENVIAICNDGTLARNTEGRIPYETVPGEKWGSSYTPDNYKTTVGKGTAWQWNTADFNEAQIGLVYDSYLHVTGNVYQTLPLYNNLKTTGNYIYATDFDIRNQKATINVKSEVRNESGENGDYSLEVNVVDHEGLLKWSFESDKTAVAAAGDAGVVYERAAEDNAYSAENLDYKYILEDPELIANKPAYDANGIRLTYATSMGEAIEVTGSADLPDKDENGNPIKYYYLENGSEKETTDKTIATLYKVAYTQCTEHREVGKTSVNTPDVTYINASYEADGVRFWSTDDPYLYTVYTVLKDASGNVVDVQSQKTGFRKVTYSQSSGISLNDEPVWLTGYAQRSTNEWAVIGIAPDWLQDWDMSLLKENNANFIRWMHVAPKPAEVRSSDKYGVAIVCPAGDKEGTAPCGRAWSQRTEAMRDAMIYFRNSPSIIFWETGNSPMGLDAKANEMAQLRDTIDPYGMRFIGARSTQSSSELNYDYNYAGTMYGNYASNAVKAMANNGKYGPIMETEYAREEAPRRVWDDFSPPDYDYVNKWLGSGGKKEDGYDIWDLTQEEATVKNVKEYSSDYFQNRAGKGSGYYSAAAMMVWSDSNMHGRNSGSENARTTGRVDPVRQTKEMFEGTRVAQSKEAAVHIVGHWSYPELSDDTYNYFLKENTGVTAKNASYWVYTNETAKRDPLNKTVYVIGSEDIIKVELYRVDGETETLIGTDDVPDDLFVYQFDNVDVTVGDAVVAKAYNARGTVAAEDRIERTYDAVGIRLTPHTAYKTDVNEDGETAIVADWRADGADIAYFDVEVVDENGNVCALNYDKITFSYEGEGVYLGGYNSGVGSGCFQQTSASEGFSKYFSGDKTGVSNIGEDYVWAENGTNRIFVRSTRNAGDFTLTASMEGIPSASMTITSNAVESEGGLTKLMQATLEPGVAEPPVVKQITPMKSLAAKKTLDWYTVKVVENADTNVYYTVTLNGTELNVSPMARLGINDMVFGPISKVLDALKEVGADCAYTFDGNMLQMKPEGGGCYTFIVGQNLMYTDESLTQSNSDLTEDMPTLEDGVMIAQLNSMLGYIEGVSYSTDNTNKTFDITFAN